MLTAPIVDAWIGVSMGYMGPTSVLGNGEAIPTSALEIDCLLPRVPTMKRKYVASSYDPSLLIPHAMLVCQDW